MPAKPYFFPWRGEVHDGRFQRRHLEYSPEKKTARFTFWRPAGAAWRTTKAKEEALWEGLVVETTGVDEFDCVVKEAVVYYELSTVYLEREQCRVTFESHYGINIAVRGAALEAKLLPEVVGPKTWRDVFE